LTQALRSADDIRSVSIVSHEGDCVKWDEIAKLLIDSKPLPKGKVRIDIESAARGQIESAALLWFLEGDLASIHSLAVAAQKLLHTEGKKIGKPSTNLTHIEAWPPKQQANWNKQRNFFQHGPDRNNPDPFVEHIADKGDVTLWDAIKCYVELHDRATPLMRLFATRFALENSYLLNPGYAPGCFLSGIAVDDIAHLCRSEFLLECLVRHGPAARAKKSQSVQDESAATDSRSAAERYFGA
jgi:hypothetical protein